MPPRSPSSWCTARRGLGKQSSLCLLVSRGCKRPRKDITVIAHYAISNRLFHWKATLITFNCLLRHLPSCSPLCQQDCEGEAYTEPRQKRMRPQPPHGRDIRQSGKWKLFIRRMLRIWWARWVKCTWCWHVHLVTAQRAIGVVSTQNGPILLACFLHDSPQYESSMTLLKHS